jgi:hypothetical protein
MLRGLAFTQGLFFSHDSSCITPAAMLVILLLLHFRSPLDIIADLSA